MACPEPAEVRHGVSYADDIANLPSFDPPREGFGPYRRGSIRLRYRMSFQMPCDHPEHPFRIVFAKGALVGAEIGQNGTAYLIGIYDGHRFQVGAGEYDEV